MPASEYGKIPGFHIDFEKLPYDDEHKRNAYVIWIEMCKFSNVTDLGKLQIICNEGYMPIMLTDDNKFTTLTVSKLCHDGPPIKEMMIPGVATKVPIDHSLSAVERKRKYSKDVGRLQAKEKIEMTVVDKTEDGLDVERLMLLDGKFVDPTSINRGAGSRGRYAQRRKDNKSPKKIGRPKGVKNKVKA